MESHQASKLDTSGTAKAVISCFQKLGVSFDVNKVHFSLNMFEISIPHKKKGKKKKKKNPS